MLLLSGCKELKLPVKPTQHEDVIKARENKTFLVCNPEIIWSGAYKKHVNISIQYGNSVLCSIKKLASDHGLNLIIDHDVDDVKTITFSMKDRSLIEILEELSALCRWKLGISDSGGITISADKPYMYMHSINVLNNTVNASISTGVNHSDKTVGSQINIGSSAHLHTITSSNVWEEVEVYLQFLIAAYKQNVPLDNADKEKAEAKLIAMEKEKEQLKFEETTKQQIKDLQQQNQVMTNGLMLGNGEMNLNAMVAPIEEKTSSEHKNKEQNTPEIAYSFNKQAGFIILKAPQHIHREMVRYLHKLESKITSQIKLEARIIEVDLKDNYSLGIDWNNMNLKNISENLSFNTQSKLSSGGAMAFTLANGVNGIEGVLHALEEFGNTHTISKPELTILNNEIGLFKVVENLVYFKISAMERGSNLNPNYTTVSRTSDAQVVPVGFSMSVQPSIDTDTGEVLLHVRPNITSVVRSIADPSVSLDAQKNNISDISSQYPVIASREFDTKLRLQPGEWAVLGGHIMSRKKQNDRGLPGVKSVLGMFMGKKTGEEHNTEIVCILRAFPEKCQIKSLQQRLKELYYKKSCLL